MSNKVKMYVDSEGAPMSGFKLLRASDGEIWVHRLSDDMMAYLDGGQPIQEVLYWEPLSEFPHEGLTDV